jgi:hypothetical protein
MRCRACDKVLNEWDSKRKDTFSGEYLDLCGHCLSQSRPYDIDQESGDTEDINNYVKTLAKD